MSTTRKDPVCGMKVEESTAAGQSEYAGQFYYFCSHSCLEDFNANPKQFTAKTDQAPGKLSKTQSFPALAAVGVLFLLFGGWSMNNSMINGGMIEQGWNHGFSWMWIPTLITLGLAMLLGWMIVGQKKF